MNRATMKAKAFAMAKRDGLINVTFQRLCDELEIKKGSGHHFLGGAFSELMAEIRAEMDPELVRKLADTSDGPKRADPTDRYQQILTAALRAAEEAGYTNLTGAVVAEGAGVGRTLVVKYFKSTQNLRDQIMHYAVAHRVPKLVAQGLAAKDPIALAADSTLKAEAAKVLVGDGDDAQ